MFPPRLELAAVLGLAADFAGGFEESLVPPTAGLCFLVEVRIIGSSSSSTALSSPSDTMKSSSAFFFFMFVVAATGVLRTDATFALGLGCAFGRAEFTATFLRGGDGLDSSSSSLESKAEGFFRFNDGLGGGAGSSSSITRSLFGFWTKCFSPVSHDVQSKHIYRVRRFGLRSVTIGDN